MDFYNKVARSPAASQPSHSDLIAESWQEAARLGIGQADSELRFRVTLRAYVYNQAYLTSDTRYFFPYYQGVKTTDFGSDDFLRNMNLLEFFRVGQGKKEFRRNWHLHFLE